MVIMQAVMVAWGETMCRNRFYQDAAHQGAGRSKSASSLAYQQRMAISQIEQYAMHVLQRDLPAGKLKAHQASPAVALPPLDIVAKNFG